MTDRLGTPGTGVVVTGGASGIGRATCLALAEVDVRAYEAIEAAVAPTQQSLGTIGGLVHAAGVAGPGPVDFIDEETWDAVLDVNLRAEAFVVRALLPWLREANPGSAVVGVASVEAIVGHAAVPAYCASKAGLLGLTRSLAHRLGMEGIRVNAICPGPVDTPMLAPIIAMPDARQSMVANVPLRRIAAPEEIGRVARFLLSDEASYVHGAAVVVDGGYTAVNPGG